MKFSNWTIDDLIAYLKTVKTSPLFDYERIPRISGEITIVNGERKDGQPIEDFVL